MARKKILFVCATGIATSTEVAERVMRYLKDNGVACDYEQTNVSAVQDRAKKAELDISTTKIPYELGVPTLRGLPLITGVGEDELLAKIKEIIQG